MLSTFQPHNSARGSAVYCGNLAAALVYQVDASGNAPPGVTTPVAVLDTVPGSRITGELSISWKLIDWLIDYLILFSPFSKVLGKNNKPRYTECLEMNLFA